MKALKKILSALALSLLAFAPMADAADDVVTVKKAINETIAKVEESIAALDKGEDKAKVSDLIVEARQLQKSISTSDAKVSMKRSKSNHQLVEARNSIISGDNKAGGELLKEALAGYKEVKEKFDATH
jgi:hypothetical protein